MLEESWDAKCSTFIESQNTEKLLKIYEKGINSGAICGKLLGAGGGGFFAFFVEQNRKKEFIKKMSPLICVMPKITFSGIEQVL